MGELYYSKERPGAKPATCVVRFFISEPQSSSVLIPKGTRVTTAENSPIWETEADTFIPAGESFTDVRVSCMENGTAGNNYTKGQINKIVDLFPYASGCENMSTRDGGADIVSCGGFV